ncbi:hypothetical protein [Pontibacter rugosus]|uniref:Uncharacterized protein n=1 Tax=Pontibacter rugosus TaxID=1745966 RepID=A0ABW3SJA7_9BACT
MELYIDNQKVDLAPDAVFAVTVQSNDITKPESVQSSYSNSLTLPYTERNHQVLSNAADVASQSRAPYTKLNASVLQDGVEVVPLPKAFLTEANEGYELQVFSGALDLFARLGDKSIRDLDLSRFNHTWDFQNVVTGARYFRDHTFGYIYDAINNGKPFTSGNLWADERHPSVFVRTVFEQMLLEAGVDYTGIDDELWEKLILPFSNDKPLHSQAWLDARKQVRDMAALTPIAVTDHGKLKVKASIFATYIGENVASSIALILRQNGVELKREEITVTALNETVLEATFDILPPYNLAGLEVLILRSNLSPESAPVAGNSRYSSFDVESSYDEEAYFRTEWDVALNLPDIKQKDFFKAIRSLLDLMVTFDPYSNMLSLTPFNRLLENRAQALDWSGKLVYVASERVPVQYRFGEFAQKSWWRYKEDELGGEGDYFLSIDDKQLEEEKNIVEMPFAASEDVAGFLRVPLFESDQKYPQNYSHTVDTIAQRNSGSFSDGNRVHVKNATADPFVKEGWAVYERKAGRWELSEQITYKRNKVEPRLAVLGGELPLLIRESRNYAVNVTGRSSSFEPISFAALLPTRYTALQGVLESCKGITPYFLLSVQDVAGYDPAVPIWLDQFQDYFYLNSINEFTGEGPTECQLWRL